MGVQPSMMKSIEDEGLSSIENILLCVNKVFLKALVQASIYHDSRAFIRAFNDFQAFTSKFLDDNGSLNFNWDGGVLFNWNSTVSYTEAFMKLHVVSEGVTVQRVLSYKFMVKVLHFSWNNSYGGIVLEASVDDEPCRISVDYAYVLINETWIKLLTVNLSMENNFIVLSFRSPHPPRVFYMVMRDENGVIVKVKFDFTT